MPGNPEQVWPSAVTRLIAVDDDGSKPVRLFEMSRTSSPIVVDYLIDDPDHVLTSRLQSAIEKISVHDGESDILESARYPTAWITDGTGVVRLRARREGPLFRNGYTRARFETAWLRLEDRSRNDRDSALRPVGFAAAGSEVLYLDWHEGRQALFSLEPGASASERLVFADPRSALPAGARART